ncbi:MAG TPA: Gldg family protein [Longimicrobiales bacterium]
MKQTWILARREFRSYFDHPTAYIVVVAFLVLALFLTFRTLFAASMASMRPFFSLLPWLFAFFIPAITMRSLAEERRSGTYQWLIAQPVDELELVVGKFLGDWFFALVALAGSLPTALCLLLVSDVDPGILVAQYVGAALLAAQMVAIGLFASSAARNQFAAFMLGVAICFGLVLIGLDVVLIGLPPALAGVVGKLSLLGHFEGIQRGVIDLRDALYFLSTALLFGALAYFLLVRERLSAVRPAFRRLQAGTAVIALGVVVLNLLGARIHGRLDLSADRLYTLSPGTRQVLEGLDDVVTIKLIVSKELPPEIQQMTLREVRDLLADYRRAADGRLQIVELNPDAGEEAASEAASLGVREIEFNVLRDNEFQVKRGWLGLAVLYADKHEVIPMITRTDDLEYRLTSMIASLTAPAKPRLAFLTGYGARSAFDFPALREVLAERYELETVDLERDSAAVLSPDTFDVVVLAAPDRPLDSAAVAKLEQYLEAGGSALLLLDGTRVDPGFPMAQRVETGLDSLLARRGVRLGRGVVYDVRSNEKISLGRSGFFTVVAPYPLWPVVLPAADHTLTRGLDALTLGWASPLEVEDSAAVQPLWATTEFGGRRPEGTPIMPRSDFVVDPSELSRQVVAVAVGPGAGAAKGEDARDGEAQASGRLVVVGDVDFLDDQFVRANPQNVAFAANALDWLARDEALIAIRSKDRTPPPLVFESEAGRAAFKWGNLAGVPLLFMLGGALRAARRRQLSRRTWGEEVKA